MIELQTKSNDIEEGPGEKNYTYIYPKNKKSIFEGKSAILHHWFKLDIDWVIENFKTREPQLYKSLFR